MKPLIVNLGWADKPNSNNRVYPRFELEQAVSDAKKKPTTNGRVFGQVDMPEGQMVELDKIGFIVGNLEVTEAGEFRGEVAWLSTPAGDAAKVLYEEAATPKPWSFRPAGIGKTRVVNGITEIYDYRITSINMVLNGA